MPDTAQKTPGKKQLDELERRFTEFRNTRTHKTAAIPDELLQAARKLGQHIDDKSVRARLGISRKQYERVAAQKQAVSDNHFVEVNNEFATDNQRQMIKMEIQLPNGAIINISQSEKSPLDLLQAVLGNNLC